MRSESARKMSSFPSPSRSAMARPYPTVIRESIVKASNLAFGASSRAVALRVAKDKRKEGFIMISDYHILAQRPRGIVAENAEASA